MWNHYLSLIHSSWAHLISFSSWIFGIRSYCMSSLCLPKKILGDSLKWNVSFCKLNVNNIVLNWYTITLGELFTFMIDRLFNIFKISMILLFKRICIHQYFIINYDQIYDTHVCICTTCIQYYINNPLSNSRHTISLSFPLHKVLLISSRSPNGTQLCNSIKQQKETVSSEERSNQGRYTQELCNKPIQFGLKSRGSGEQDQTRQHKLCSRKPAFKLV